MVTSYKALKKLIKRQIDYQIERYSSTIFGKLFGVLIYCLIFTLVPTTIRIVVPWLRTRLTQKEIYIVLTFTAVVGTTLAFNIVMYFVYLYKIPFLQQYRCNPDKPWPWQQNRQKWMKLLIRSILLTAFSQLILVPILLYVDVSIKFTVIMDVTNPPTFMQMLPHFLIFQIMEDFMFFIAHRLLHTPFFYRYHKIHHQYTTTVSIAGLHSHAIQFLISNTITIAVYMAVAQGMFGPIHINAKIIWTFLRMWDAYNGHCGYMFSWAPLQLLPFCASDDYHDFHHSANCGNYAGQFRLLDTFLGYNEDFWLHVEERKIKQAKDKNV